MFKHVIEPESDSGTGFFYTINEIIVDYLKYRVDCSYTARVDKPQLIAEAIRACQSELLTLNQDQLSNGRKTNFKIVGYEFLTIPTISQPENTYVFFICQDFENLKEISVLY
jgi:hypothetical protein